MKSTPLWTRSLGYVALVLFLLLTLGLLAINYVAGIALLLGIALAWLTRITARFVSARGWGLKFVIALLGVIILVTVVLVFGISLILSFGRGAGPVDCDPTKPADVALPKEYRVTLVPQNDAAETFTFKEEVDVVEQKIICRLDTPSTVLSEEKATVILPEGQTKSEARGFLLRQVRLAPLGADAFGTAHLKLPNGHSVEIFLSGVPSKVVLDKMPRNSFYDALDKKELATSTYLDQETIRWSVADLTHAVVFAYIQPPYQILRPLIAPFLGAANINDWAMALVGALGAVIVSPIVAPVLTEIAKSRFKTSIEEALNKPRKKKSKR